MVCYLMEEESTFYPHYQIYLKIDEPPKPLPGGKSLGYSRGVMHPMKKGMKRGQLPPIWGGGLKGPRKGAILKADIVEWLDENLGKDHYHLGRDKIVVSTVRWEASQIYVRFHHIEHMVYYPHQDLFPIFLYITYPLYPS